MNDAADDQRRPRRDRHPVEGALGPLFRLLLPLALPLTLADSASTPLAPPQAYDHLHWIGHEIIDAFSRPVERTGSARRAHAARTWFQQGVLSRVSKAEFEHESAEKRTGAIAELDWVRVELEQGRNPATGKRVEASGYELLVRPSSSPTVSSSARLPADEPLDLRQQPGLADLSHFHALNALLDDVDRMRRAAEAVRASFPCLRAPADTDGYACHSASSRTLSWTPLRLRAARPASTRRACVVSLPLSPPSALSRLAE